MKEVLLTKGQKCLVDDEDYDVVSRHKWKAVWCTDRYYAGRTVKSPSESDGISKGGILLMHRFIMGAKKGQEIDHRNNNSLDNRRENLRFCTSSQNRANCMGPNGEVKYRPGRSKYKGVYWNKEKQKWQAQIGNSAGLKGRLKTIYLGRFDSEEEAALAYNKKALELRGAEWARLNVVPEKGR